MLQVDRESLLAFRARASYLDRKLPPESFEQAAYGGLQDSAPRAAVISLHARVRAVTPSSWEHESLCQIWGPRGADYLIPRRDLAVFTIGRMPRDSTAAESLERIAEDVHRICQGSDRPTREVSAALPELGHSIRMGAITGRLLIRWDASRIRVIPVERPAADYEEARLELGRRFLAWFGPVTEQRFAWWAGLDPEDARLTWSALRSEMIEVDLSGETRCLLKEQEEAMVRSDVIRGVRLIPHSDPYIKTDGELVVEDSRRRLEIFPVPRIKPDFWPVSGAVLADNEVIGSWARQQRRVTVNLWERVNDSLKEEIESEAIGFPIDAPYKAEVRWAQ